MGSSPSPSPATGLHRRILALDATVSRSVHTVAEHVVPTFLLLLLEISADFRFSFPVGLSLLFSPRLRSFLLPFLVGLLFDLLLIGLVKIIFRRSRPTYNHHSMSAAVSADHYSFPSGHASRVFYVAAFVHLADAALPLEVVEYPLMGIKGAVGLGIWLWAAATATSRVFLGRHYVLDVMAGASLGILEALFVFRFVRLEKVFPRLWNEFVVIH